MEFSPVRQLSGIVFDDFIRSQPLFPDCDDQEPKAAAASFRSLVSALTTGDIRAAAHTCKSLSRFCRSRNLSAKSFAMLALEEATWACRISGKTMPGHGDLANALGMSLVRYARLRSRISLRSFRRGGAAEACRAFRDFQTAERAYAALPVRNCTVCATVSAGKSTFINALLGRDVLPARNEATTAKITSVYDCDGDTRVAGFFRRKDGTTDGHSPDVTLPMLDAWNCDPSVSEIHLRGDFDGIRNRGFAVAIHDTPGTNNSSDAAHRRMTLDFLASAPPDLVLLVLDAEHPGTNDEADLLKEVFRRTCGIPVLSIFNKAEEFDPENEDLQGAMDRTKANLEKIGYKNPPVLPVSALAARLFKMTLRGRGAEMTEKERDEFPVLAAKFRKRDFSGAEGSGETEQGGTKRATHRKTISGGLPPDALERTGIVRIERWIETALSDKKGARK